MSREIRMTLQLVDWNDTEKRSTYHKSVIVGEALDAVSYNTVIKYMVRFAGMTTDEAFVPPIFKD